MKKLLYKLKASLTRYFLEPRFHFSRLQFNLISVFLVGIGVTIGLYFTALHLIPGIFAANDTNKNWAFSSTTASNYTYDNTLVTVDNSGARPITGVNKFTNPGFSSDASSWTAAAVTGSTSPANWIVVPGSSTYSTTDFLAMKYDAKNVGGVATSQAASTPWVSITQTAAITACSAIGSTYHLINNNEYMTIARNAEAQAGNWSGGSVGSGYLYAGHNDNAPANAIAASTTDTGNNACAYTDTAGTTEAPSPCPSNTANGQSGTAGNQKRVLTLSNGSYVWDLAGNVWEWTNNIQSSAIDTTAGWVEWNSSNIATGARDLYGPSSASYLSAYGVGQVYGGALNNAF